jgi:nucleoside-diphosphate-sugar epimerase
VHIEDIGRAFIAVLNAPREKTHNMALNVGVTEENYRVSELAEIVRQTVPGSVIEFAKDGGPDARNYRVDFGRINGLLPEFKARWTARQGAQELHAAYQRVGLELADYEGPRYRRIDHLKHLMSEGRIDENLRWCGNPQLA